MQFGPLGLWIGSEFIPQRKRRSDGKFNRLLLFLLFLEKKFDIFFSFVFYLNPSTSISTLNPSSSDEEVTLEEPPL